MNEKTKRMMLFFEKIRTYFRHLRSVIGLVALIIAAILLSPHASDGTIVFLEGGNITDILRQVSEIGIMALGMTFVILTAGIDLSVGSVLAFSASIIALTLDRWAPGIGYAAHILMAILLGLGASAAMGAVNGFIIARLNMQPFIVTLASMIGVRGLARWLTDNANIDIGFGEDVSAVFADIFSQKYLVIGTFLMLAFIFSIILSRTVFGRHVKALGDNEKAAQYSGLPIMKIKIWVYALAGLMAGLAGVIHAAQNHQGSPNAGIMYELEAIAAVVIGGTSLMGGKGSISGTMIGTLIVGILTNILRLNNVDANVEMMLKAMIIIAAVWIQQSEKRSL